MTDGHLDATVLAEYDEGLLTPPRAGEVESHLAGCASCAAVLEQLGQVRAQLADLPAEITMPASMAAQIDQALAAERAHLERELPLVRTATVHPFRHRLPQLLAAAATIAVVAFAGYAATSGGGDDSGDAVTSAESAADAGESDDSGAGGAREDSAAGGEAAAPEPPLPAPDERTALTEQIQAVVSANRTFGGDTVAPQQLADDCGVVLARDLGAELIGVAGTDIGQPAAVLVVVETDQPDVAQGFVLPECGAGLDEALRELTVPTE